MEKYGRDYRSARKEKLKDMKYPHCEVTAGTEHLEAHHNVPKLFNGADVKENLIILKRDFHAYIHEVCNVKNNELVYQRQNIAKKMLQDINGLQAQHYKKQLDDIDEILMREYVDNMILGISDRYRDKILGLTLISQMQTIKTLTIKLLQAEDKISRMEANNSTTHER
jgi:hypothetical protein